MRRAAPVLLASLAGASALLLSPGVRPARAGGAPPAVPRYSPDEQKEFLDFEKQADEFAGAQHEYRSTVGGILRRTYEAQRRQLAARYQQQLSKLDMDAERERLDAIAALRNFLHQYPNDPNWTPDVEFRLALLTFDEETRAKTDGGPTTPTTLPAASQPPLQIDTWYPQTIALLSDLITRFPDYRFIDQAEFALAYAIDPTDTAPAAMPYYRAVVCSNKFSPHDPAPSFVGDEAYAEAAAEHRPAPPPPPPLPKDLYDGCRPYNADSPILQESWIRIGEFHFNNTGQLDASEQAYKEATKAKGNQFDFAVYKLGWTYFRDNRFLDAIQEFDQDILWSDERVKEGKDSSDTRDEAVRYIAFCFQDADWDNDGQPDPTPGYQKMESFYRNRWQEPHVREVYVGLAKLYHEFGEYLNAAHTYELIERHWPYTDDAPQIQESIAEEYQAAHDEQSATHAREVLGDLYGRDSDWAAHNRNNPDAIERAQDLARNSLLIGADSHRLKAYALLQDASAHARDKQQALNDNLSALEQYVFAADAYAAYVRRYPSAPDIYKIHFFLAQSYDGAGTVMAVLGKDNYATVAQRNLAASSQAAASQEAASSQPARVLFNPDYDTQLRGWQEQGAIGYEWVRDHRELAPPKFDKSEIAADYACSVREGVVQQDQALALFTVPPVPDNAANKPALPIAVQPIPEDEQKLIVDYDAYAKAYPDSKTTPPKLLDAAVIQYRYLHWEDDKGPSGEAVPGARTRFQQLRDAYCGKAKEADDAGQAILASYVIENNLDKMDYWAKQLQDQQCGSNLADNAKLAELQAGIAFKRAEQVMKKGQCAEPNAAIDVQDCQDAAQRYLDIVKRFPDYEHDDVAVQDAAVCYEHIHEYDKSIGLYEQLFDPHGPYAKSKDVDIPSAIFQAASDHKRFFEFEDALREYKLLFAPEYKGNPLQFQAMISAAILEENLQEYAEAADLYKRISDMPTIKPIESIDALQSAGRCYQDAKLRAPEIATLKLLIQQARGVPNGGDYMIRAEYRQAELAEEDHNHRDALDMEKRLVDDFYAAKLAPDSTAAEYAAHAFFDLAQEQYKTKYKTGGLRFNPDDANPKRQQQSVVNNEKAAVECGKTFQPLFSILSGGAGAFNRASWLFAGWYMAGQCWQDLGDLYQNAPLPKALSSFPQEAQDAYTNGINGEVQKYDNNAQAIWKKLLQAAQANAVSNDWTRHALKQMNGYDPQDYPMFKDPKVGLALSAPAAR